MCMSCPRRLGAGERVWADIALLQGSTNKQSLSNFSLGQTRHQDAVSQKLLRDNCTFWGGGFPVEDKGIGEGVRGGGGLGGGGDRQRNRQVNAQALSKRHFSKLPFSNSSKDC